MLDCCKHVDVRKVRADRSTTNGTNNTLQVLGVRGVEPDVDVSVDRDTAQGRVADHSAVVDHDDECNRGPEVAKEGPECPHKTKEPASRQDTQRKVPREADSGLDLDDCCCLDGSSRAVLLGAATSAADTAVVRNGSGRAVNDQ